MTGKPPYAIPFMDEVRAIPWNGFNAVSTFSGCGGSSLGYRMAGFRMLWASEFIPAAQDTYRANASPRTVLDTRDIRDVTGAEILAATGLDIGEIDLFDGSPPCASFSVAGKRESHWGKVKKYSDTRQRTDDLFFEYIRLIEETQPRVFIAENVAGLVKGSAKGYFKIILKELKACGYQVVARVLNAMWLGVPQTRNRLIIIGVRNDLKAAPVHPKPLPYRYTVRDVLPYILFQGSNGAFGSDRLQSSGKPSGSFGADLGTGNGLCPPSVVVDDGEVADTKLVDPETGKKLSMIGYAIYEEWRNLRPGQESQRYFQVRRQHLDQPHHSILATSENVSSAGGSHWAEPRNLNLIELRALSGFPSDFVLTGTYAQRWERIGRAVPPVMMAHIATAIRDDVLAPLRATGAI